MLLLYKTLLIVASPLLWGYLHLRALKGKEIKLRLGEKRGQSSLPRPDGQLIWIHAASVGESQSALALIHKLTANNPALSFIITSVTVTSAEMLNKNLPSNAHHQFVPLDNPIWVNRFLKHWKPDLALFLESEIWPNMVLELKSLNTPLLLINARLSKTSFKRWKKLGDTANTIFESFSLILTQTKTDTDNFLALGGNAKTAGNIKLNAALLPVKNDDLQEFTDAITDRPTWVYASTHHGEEEIATRIHEKLQKKFSRLLTIIVPRHPARCDDIIRTLSTYDVTIKTRENRKNLPKEKTNIYIANTLGELGLFYRASPIAMIGRSLSADGGGGHNPIEAAQLDCAVLTGPHIQFQKNLFDPMFMEGAATQINTEDELCDTLEKLFSNKSALMNARKKSKNYIQGLENILDNVVTNIENYLPKTRRN